MVVEAAEVLGVSATWLATGRGPMHAGDKLGTSEPDVASLFRRHGWQVSWPDPDADRVALSDGTLAHLQIIGRVVAVSGGI